MTADTEARPPKRERKRARMRRELAEVAVELFESQGVAGTTVEQIADGADYSASTVFRQFEGKEDIIFFDFPERLEALREALAAHEGRTAWRTIRAALVDNAHWWEDDLGDFGRRRAELFHREPILHRRYLEISEEWELEIAKLVARERQADPEHDVSSRLLAGAVVSGFRAAWRGHLAGDGSLADLLSQAFDQLERGFA